MTRNVEPIRETDGAMFKNDGAKRYTHPAFAVISASRINGHKDLFGSNIVHQGFVRLTIRQAELERDGYSDFVHAKDRVLEVDMSEAQWVALVSRPNIGDGITCTLSAMRDGTYTQLPELPPVEDAKERLEQQAADQIREMERRFAEGEARIAGMIEKLPKKLQGEVLSVIRSIAPVSKSTREFQAKCLHETNEKLVNDAKIEIDALMTNAVNRLGVASAQQLGVILSADPDKALQLIATLPHEEDAP